MSFDRILQVTITDYSLEVSARVSKVKLKHSKMVC